MAIMVRYSKEQDLVVHSAAKSKGMSVMNYVRSAALHAAKQDLREFAKNLGNEELVRRAVNHMRSSGSEETQTENA